MSSWFSGGTPEMYAARERRSTAALGPGNHPNSQIRQDFPMGKRSFSEFQFQQQLGRPLTLLQQQYLLRSLKQRSNFYGSTRFGVPVYQLNPGVIGSGLPGPNRGVSEGKIDGSRTAKALTLQELEKQLLDDDDDDDGETVSVVTNSEWSETFQNLMGHPKSNPNPNPNPNPSPSPMNSPSPTTSSTSSCCSSTASQPIASPKQLISEAAMAISEGKSGVATEILTRLSRVVDPKGAPEQRVGFYLGNALRSRVNPGENPPPLMEPYSKEQMGSMYLLYDLSPCFKFGFLAANLVIIDAISNAQKENCNKVRIIDFNLGCGGQYFSLLRLLAERKAHAPPCSAALELRITAVETEAAKGIALMPVEKVREELMKQAERAGVRLRFESVTRLINDLTSESLGCDSVAEAVVVNLAFKLHRVPDESVSMENLRDALLRRVKGLSPRIVTLVEQEMNCNTTPFLTRVNEACSYYTALFESFESGMTREDPNRVRVDEGLGRIMANTVACEGRERVERFEVLGKWRARMGMAGFEMKPLSQQVAESMRARLSNLNRRASPGFTVREENGGVGFGWANRVLTVASAWR